MSTGPPPFTGVAQPVDPLAQFTAPPALDPLDLVEQVPPFERSSYEMQTVLTVVANELARIDAARQALIANFFPHSADVLLEVFEQLLGLPVDPPSLSLDARQALVSTYMSRFKAEGTGLEWQAAITSLVGTNWTYAEHDPANPSSPVAYELTVNIPPAFAGVGWPLIRDLTPAHLDINQSYSGGFIVGVSTIGSNL